MVQLQEISYIQPGDDKPAKLLAILHNEDIPSLPSEIPTLPPALLPLPYELSESPGKGVGLFATRSIQMGEILLFERPLLIYPVQFPVHAKLGLGGTADLWLSRFLPEDREAFLSLRQHREDIPGFWGILYTNGLEITLKGTSNDLSGIFPVASRINHR